MDRNYTGYVVLAIVYEYAQYFHSCDTLGDNSTASDPGAYDSEEDITIVSTMWLTSTVIIQSHMPVYLLGLVCCQPENALGHLEGTEGSDGLDRLL